MPETACPRCGKYAQCYAKRTGQVTFRYTLKCSYCGHRETTTVHVRDVSVTAPAKPCALCKMPYAAHTPPPIGVMVKAGSS
ncbi:MAG: hypothetical protein PHH01_01775 [Patescibacteria group bacterium]|nr:hypothetical protein [Patescibacteria group bacterium]